MQKKTCTCTYIYCLFMRGETLLLVPFPSVGDSEQISVRKNRLDCQCLNWFARVCGCQGVLREISPQHFQGRVNISCSPASEQAEDLVIGTSVSANGRSAKGNVYIISRSSRATDADRHSGNRFVGSWKEYTRPACPHGHRLEHRKISTDRA